MAKRKLKSFTASAARPLPVIILADTSGSMSEDGKIEALNVALKDMLESFALESEGRAEIHVSLITFGGTAKIHQPIVPASELEFSPFAARGSTPLGAALDLARELIEDRECISSRAYTPAIMLISDGQPTENPDGYWKQALGELHKSERATKAQRFALGIGEDADVEVLKAFIGNSEGKVYGALDARQIKNYFKWFTMSIASRTRSANPNSVEFEGFEPDDLDELL